MTVVHCSVFTCNAANTTSTYVGSSFNDALAKEGLPITATEMVDVSNG